MHEAKIDRDSPIGLHEQVAGEIRRAIADGEAKPGERLPPAANGKSLLYVDDDGVWLLPTLDAKPARIATPLVAPSSWPSYFGQIAWPSQLAWWSK